MRARRLVLAGGVLLALLLTVAVGVDSLRDPEPDRFPNGPGAALPPEPPPVDLTLFAGEPDLPPSAPGEEPGSEPPRRERLGGRVVTGDGVSVPNVTVICVRREENGKTTRVQVRTDDHGRWEAEVTEGEPWNVQVTGSLPGGVPILRKSSATIRTGRADRVLTVEPAEEVQGRVLDPVGRTVAGANVEIWSSMRKGRGPHFRLQTDEHGAFRAFLPAGGTARIKAYVPTTDDVGLPYCRAFASKVSPGEPVDLQLTEGAEIRGRIAWRDGGPAKDLPLRAHQDLGSHPMVIRARTNAHGEFRIGGLFSSMGYRLEIDAGRFEGEPLDLIGVVRMKAGTMAVNLEIAPAVLATGTLYRPSGEPAGRWRFWFMRDGSSRKISSRTKEDGTFVLRTAANGTYTAWTYVVVNRKRHRVKCGTFRSGDSGIVLRIPQP